VEGEVAQLQYLLMVRLVHHVYKKDDATRGVFPTLDAIGHQFCTELATLMQVPVESPWSKPTPQHAAASGSGDKRCAVASAMVDFSADLAVDNLLDILGGKGFKVGCQVQRKSDMVRFKLTAIAGQQGTLVDEAGAVINVRVDSLLKGNFKPLQEEKATSYISNWLKLAEPSSSLEWRGEVATSRIKLALDAAHTKHSGVLKHVEIIKEPSSQKGVLITADIPRGELVLIPLTPTVSLQPITKECSILVDCGMEIKDGRDAARRRKIILAKKDVQPSAKANKMSSAERGQLVKEDATPFVIPYWHVEHTADEDDPRINMIIKLVTDEEFGDKVKYPVMSNRKAIKKNDVLVVFIADETKAKAKAAKESAAKRHATPTPPPAQKRIKKA
jgi:hypothetical protein